MSHKQKLLFKLTNSPNSFTFDDAESLLGCFGYYRSDKGKTSGSRVVFVNVSTSAKIMLHRPHPQKELRHYQIKQLLQHLYQEGLL